MSEEVKEKRIELIRIPLSELKFSFGNPRKIKRQAQRDLKKSLEDLGDFGVIVLDEFNNVVSGTQRCRQLAEIDVNSMVDCKRLTGYSEMELRSINIRANTHAGEWDLSLLANWTADLNLDLGINLNNVNREERTINEMELVRFEKYNYVVIACRTDIDYDLLTQKLGIKGKTVKLHEKRKIDCRAIWFDKCSDKFK